MQTKITKLAMHTGEILHDDMVYVLCSARDFLLFISTASSDSGCGCWHPDTCYPSGGGYHCDLVLVSPLPPSLPPSQSSFCLCCVAVAVRGRTRNTVSLVRSTTWRSWRRGRTMSMTLSCVTSHPSTHLYLVKGQHFQKQYNMVFVVCSQGADEGNSLPTVRVSCTGYAR